MNQTLTMFRGLFEEDLKLLRNPICDGCNPEFRNPLLPWLVGSGFSRTRERVAFIGKPHRGVPGEVLESGIIDPTESVRSDLWNRGWPYWRYTREIAEDLYGDQAFDSIAFTNLIKCTNSHGTDLTTETMARSCVGDLGVIWRELEAIKPLAAIFYTYSLYPHLLEKIPLATAGSLREVTTYQHRVRCGEKQLGWWERVCATSWTDTFRILVVGHPERQKKADFVRLVVNWIRAAGG